MFIPLHDANPLRSISFQYVTLAIIILNVAIFVFLQSGLFLDVGAATTADLAVVPCQLLGHGLACLPPSGASVAPVPELATPITYMFLHGGWLHLAGNMLFLWVFGDNVEDDMGHERFLVFYLLCGIVAGYVHSLAAPTSNVPLIGASGAIAGVIAAYLMLHPNVMVWVLAFGFVSITIRAVWVLSAWILMQVLSLISAGDSHTAWWAHIGGFAAGAILVLFLRRPGVKLFQ